MDYYDQGFIKPITPCIEFPADKIEDTFRYMQKGQHIGKLVVAMPNKPFTLPVMPGRSKLRLRPDRAYLFVGGLGGLGRAVATWLVENGAKHIVFFSRSAGNIPENDPYLCELRTQRCFVQTISGSVYSTSDLNRSLEAIRSPIGGVLQASMVLDVRFRFTSWELVLICFPGRYDHRYEI